MADTMLDLTISVIFLYFLLTVTQSQEINYDRPEPQLTHSRSYVLPASDLSDRRQVNLKPIIYRYRKYYNDQSGNEKFSPMSNSQKEETDFNSVKSLNPHRNRRYKVIYKKVYKIRQNGEVDANNERLAKNAVVIKYANDNNSDQPIHGLFGNTNYNSSVVEIDPNNVHRTAKDSKLSKEKNTNNADNFKNNSDFTEESTSSKEGNNRGKSVAIVNLNYEPNEDINNIVVKKKNVFGDVNKNNDITELNLLKNNDNKNKPFKVVNRRVKPISFNEQTEINNDRFINQISINPETADSFNTEENDRQKSSVDNFSFHDLINEHLTETNIAMNSDSLYKKYNIDDEGSLNRKHVNSVDEMPSKYFEPNSYDGDNVSHVKYTPKLTLIAIENADDYAINAKDTETSSDSWTANALINGHNSTTYQKYKVYYLKSDKHPTKSNSKIDEKMELVNIEPNTDKKVDNNKVYMTKQNSSHNLKASVEHVPNSSWNTQYSYLDVVPESKVKPGTNELTKSSLNFRHALLATPSLVSAESRNSFGISDNSEEKKRNRVDDKKNETEMSNIVYANKSIYPLLPSIEHIKGNSEIIVDSKESQDLKDSGFNYWNIDKHIEKVLNVLPKSEEPDVRKNHSSSRSKVNVADLETNTVNTTNKKVPHIAVNLVRQNLDGRLNANVEELPNSYWYTYHVDGIPESQLGTNQMSSKKNNISPINSELISAKSKISLVTSGERGQSKEKDQTTEIDVNDAVQVLGTSYADENTYPLEQSTEYGNSETIVDPKEINGNSAPSLDLNNTTKVLNSLTKTEDLHEDILTSKNTVLNDQQNEVPDWFRKYFSTICQNINEKLSKCWSTLSRTSSLNPNNTVNEKNLLIFKLFSKLNDTEQFNRLDYVIRKLTFNENAYDKYRRQSKSQTVTDPNINTTDTHNIKTMFAKKWQSKEDKEKYLDELYSLFSKPSIEYQMLRRTYDHLNLDNKEVVNILNNVSFPNEANYVDVKNNGDTKDNVLPGNKQYIGIMPDSYNSSKYFPSSSAGKYLEEIYLVNTSDLNKQYVGIIPDSYNSSKYFPLSSAGKYLEELYSAYPLANASDLPLHSKLFDGQASSVTSEFQTATVRRTNDDLNLDNKEVVDILTNVSFPNVTNYEDVKNNSDTKDNVLPGNKRYIGIMPDSYEHSQKLHRPPLNIIKETDPEYKQVKTEDSLHDQDNIWLHEYLPFSQETISINDDDDEDDNHQGFKQHSLDHVYVKLEPGVIKPVTHKMTFQLENVINDSVNVRVNNLILQTILQLNRLGVLDARLENFIDVVQHVIMPSVIQDARVCQEKAYDNFVHKLEQLVNK